MKLDAALHADDLDDVPSLAVEAERSGLDGLWTSETSHSPLFPLVLAAEHTATIELGTAIAVAFARSPMDVAYQAWDLARLSRGRFRLGLGTQVSAHIRRRFGMSWPERPVEAFREYIEALRAIWHAWQTGERLNYRGDVYKLTLMAPLFDPGPIEWPDVPIFTAGVNARMCRLAGEVSDGFHAHPFHSKRYLTEVVLPQIQAGLTASGRSRTRIEVSSTVFVAAGSDQAEIDTAVEDARRQISFYASTPTYARVMELHGWGEAGQALGRLAARKRWDDMPPLVTDEMVDTFAIVCDVRDAGERLVEKYAGLLDRMTVYRPFGTSDEDRDFWVALARGLRVADVRS